MKLVALLALSFLLFGCANKKSKVANKAPVDIVGMSKDKILSCAGAPAKSVQSNKTEVLSYSYNGSEAAQKLQCTASFVFQRDILKSYNYSGQMGGLAVPGQQCGFIVANCLKR